MSSPLNASYSIGKHAEACAATGRAFEPGEACMTCLVESDEDEGLERQDYSLEGWASARPDRVFASWRTEAPRPDAPPRAIAGDEELLDLFESMGDASEAKRLAFRYALALLMIRKRLLRQVAIREATDAAPGALLVRPKGSDPEAAPIEVINPPLGPAILADVLTQLEAIVRSDA